MSTANVPGHPELPQGEAWINLLVGAEIDAMYHPPPRWDEHGNERPYGWIGGRD